MPDPVTTSSRPEAAPLLSRERIIASPGFNRWTVPPAALAIHLCIGMAYGFSVFWLPLSRAIGITQSAPEDWKISTLGWMFTLFFVMLGSSAALFGAWVEREGPRKAGVVSAVCWSGGFFISALGIYLHQIWMLWLGSGVIGGCGLGLGYISPVSTLIKWFPDRRGMATGLAIMGFGGGAMIGTPLADVLMKYFATPASVGVWQTFVVLGVIYFVVMMAGAFGYRLPHAGWKPAGWTPPADTAVTADRGSVPVDVAWRTKQFWLEWVVLCMNVTAGIGILGIASPMIQEIFKGRVTASAAAGFIGLLSLFNIAGRIFWASLSDRIGRKTTYMVFFALGMLLYASAPTAGRTSLGVFVAIYCIIISMYGGGFSTIPAYLADTFGVGNVSAIHGRILTAWSTAGILGPVLVNYIREFQLDRGVAPANVYTFTAYILVAFLGVGLVCNLAVRAVDRSLFTLAPARKAASAGGAAAVEDRPGEWGLVAIGWLLAGIPICWGVYKTLALVSQMFR
ncbi:MAG TPA: OFA family MFS transporter [Vicinamibacterales bacterium]|nr:OFA family MFS transporter [Vicinamibacterales bacterium]